jgi:hypothetical protein
MANLTNERGRSLHMLRRLLEVQVKHLTFRPTSTQLSEININTNVLFRISTRIHTRTRQSRVSNLKGISIHWELPYLRPLSTCAKRVILSHWIQLQHQIRFQRIGTRACIAIFIRRQGIVLMNVHD